MKVGSKMGDGRVVTAQMSVILSERDFYASEI